MANSKVQLHPPAEKKTLWAWLVGTFFGAGLLKPGPGTYGSIAALIGSVWHMAHAAIVTRRAQAAGHVRKASFFAKRLAWHEPSAQP